jgi:myo-inositol 2-dehydrogenase/D-chiro-inositol 1-dehydrogenase
MSAAAAASPVRIGLAGLGRMGRRHARNLAQRTPGARIVAACDPDPDSLEWARSSLGVANVFRDYRSLLAQPDVDAVWIATPLTEHAEQVIQALDAGKHAFCEKPLSLDVGDCLRVEQAAARHPKLKVMIGFVRRFDPSYRDAYEKTRAGAIGRPFLVRSQTADQYDPSGFFVAFAPKSGGIFVDMNVHDIDLARWYLGGAPVRRVFAAGTIAIHEGLRDCGDVDNGLSIVEFADGRLAYFYASRMLAHGHETLTEIVGTAGRLTVGHNPRLNRVEIADAHGVRNECTPTFYERFEEAFVNECAEFVAAIRDDRPPALALRDATEATRIGRMLAESYRTGRAIDAERPAAA